MAIVSVTGDTSTASVIIETDYSGLNYATVWRYIGGKPQEVRGYVLKETGQEVPPFRDYEAPLGVQVGYASLNWTTTKPAPPAIPTHYATVNVVDTTAWIKFPAHPEQNFPLDCVAVLPERQFEANAETYRIIGRSKPIAIHDVMTWWAGEISWITKSQWDHDRAVIVITAGSICMIQTMPAYGAIHEFVMVSSLKTAHIGPATAEHTERLITLGFQTIDAPVGAYSVTVTYTYNQMKADWPDYDSVNLNYANYYSLYLNDRR